jgi:acyl dehydratase
MASDEPQDSLISPEIQALIGMETGRKAAFEDVSTSEIRRFAQATFDENPVYYDPEAGAKTKFQGLVAPASFPIHMVRTRPLGVPDRMLDPDWDGREIDPSEAQEKPEVKWPEGYTTFHGGDELEVYQLARPGERITATSRIANIYDREGRSGRLGLVVRETIYTNDKGEVLCINRNTMVARQDPGR